MGVLSISTGLGWLRAYKRICNSMRIAAGVLKDQVVRGEVRTLSSASMGERSKELAGPALEPSDFGSATTVRSNSQGMSSTPALNKACS